MIPGKVETKPIIDRETRSLPEPQHAVSVGPQQVSTADAEPVSRAPLGFRW